MELLLLLLLLPLRRRCQNPVRGCLRTESEKDDRRSISLVDSDRFQTAVHRHDCTLKRLHEDAALARQVTWAEVSQARAAYSTVVKKRLR